MHKSRRLNSTPVRSIVELEAKKTPNSPLGASTAIYVSSFLTTKPSE